MDVGNNEKPVRQLLSLHFSDFACTIWIAVKFVSECAAKRTGVAVAATVCCWKTTRVESLLAWGRQMPPISPLLENQQVFRTRDPDAAATFLGRKGFRLDIPKRHVRALDVHANCACLPSIIVGYLHFGPAVTTVPEYPGNDYLVTFPLAGRVGVSMRGQSIRCDQENAAVMSYPPAPADPICSDAGCERLNVTLMGDAVMRQLATLLGGPLKQPLLLAPELSLAEGHGRRLVSLLRIAVADFEAAGGIPWHPLSVVQFEQFILTELLLSHPHNYSEALRRLECPIVPRDVKRALDYIHANLHAAVTLTDLVRMSRVPGRTLFKHFRDYKGVSPMRYLRNARLEKVRDALLRAETEEGVSAIALNWGFSHMGRFSLAYRARFGESPSQTLLRRR
jgi:AraC-like DNA-binding protein